MMDDQGLQGFPWGNRDIILAAVNALPALLDVAEAVNDAAVYAEEAHRCLQRTAVRSGDVEMARISAEEAHLHLQAALARLHGKEQDDG